MSSKEIIISMMQVSYGSHLLIGPPTDSNKDSSANDYRLGINLDQKKAKATDECTRIKC